MGKRVSFASAAAVAVVTLVVAGCTTTTVPPRPAGTQYVSVSTVIAGRPDVPTMYDLESSAQQLMSRMRSSPRFVENYNVAKNAKGRIPLVVIGNIENKTKERVQGRLDSVCDTLRASLYDTGLFEVKDDEAGEAILSRITRGADGGLETSSLVQFVGTQDSPDYILLGDFRHFEDVGGYHTYRLRLAIHDIATGKVVWEGVQTQVKL